MTDNQQFPFTTIKQFSSFEEAMNAMAEAEAAANENLAPEQSALTWGSTWVRFDHVPSGVLIVGRCATIEEVEAGERECAPKIEDYPVETGPPVIVDEFTADTAEFEGELAGTLAQTRDSHERGYLFGRAYSAIEPDGELGSTHRANAWPISPECFDALRRASYHPHRLSLAAPALAAELESAYKAWAHHELAKARATRQAGQTTQGDHK